MIHHVVDAYNDTVHPATGYAPREILLAVKPYTQVDKLTGVQLKPTAGDKEEVVHQATAWHLKIQAVIAERMKSLHKRAVQNYIDNKSNQT